MKKMGRIKEDGDRRGPTISSVLTLNVDRPCSALSFFHRPIMSENAEA
jgi:hypothetical protein